MPLDFEVAWRAATIRRVNPDLPPTRTAESSRVRQGMTARPVAGHIRKRPVLSLTHAPAGGYISLVGEATDVRVSGVSTTHLAARRLKCRAAPTCMPG